MMMPRECRSGESTDLGFECKRPYFNCRCSLQWACVEWMRSEHVHRRRCICHVDPRHAHVLKVCSCVFGVHSMTSSPPCFFLYCRGGDAFVVLLLKKALHSSVSLSFDPFCYFSSYDDHGKSCVMD
jgi:hypothetical protein